MSTVFVFGSKALGLKYESNELLAKEVREKLDELIAAEDGIIIGDCHGVDHYIQNYLGEKGYGKVTVYYSGPNDIPRINKGAWDTKHFKVSRIMAGYIARFENDLHMAMDADYGIAVWDGKSIGTYAKMASLAALGKRIHLYLVGEKQPVVIEKLEDLEEYAGAELEWDETVLNSLICKCGISDEVREYIVKGHCLNPVRVVEIVCQAPISLSEKTDILNGLRDKTNINREIYDRLISAPKDGKKRWNTIKEDILFLRSKWFHICRAAFEIHQAKEILNITGKRKELRNILYLFEEWYDTDVFIEKSCSVGMFKDIESVLDYIKRENEEYEAGTTLGDCYRAELWALSDIGKYTKLYDYYIFGDEVCWFEKFESIIEENGDVYYRSEGREFFSGRSDLEFPLPYKPGNIVSIDCRPFGPPFNAVILETEPEWDCCKPTVIFKVPATDMWRMITLKHRRLYKDAEFGSYCPALSPLFRIKRAEVQADTDEHRLLARISDFLNKDEQLAEHIWNLWTEKEKNCEDLSKDDMMYVLMEAGMK